jgi:hypothetical protein
MRKCEEHRGISKKIAEKMQENCRENEGKLLTES